MNQKFKELREQALKEVEYMLETEGSENGAVMYREHLDLVNQRFAELIVLRCSNIIYEYGGGTDSDEGNLYNLCVNIEKHFEIVQ